MNPWQLPPAPVPSAVRDFLEKKQVFNRLGAWWRIAGYSWESLPDDGGELWLMVIAGFDSPDKFLSPCEWSDPTKAREQIKTIMNWNK